LIATIVGKPDLNVGDFIAIEAFCHNEIMPDPQKPTHVVSMDAHTSPEWAQQERWIEIIRQLCVPCKEHGTFPVLGEQFLAVAKDRPLAIGNLTVHCPDKACKYYAEDYAPARWNALMK
jgi:hypothetical protein